MLISATPIGNGKAKITVKCPFCGKISEVVVDFISYRNWISMGLHVQDAFQNESPETRELLLTGICIECQDVAFAEDEDDNDY